MKTYELREMLLNEMDKNVDTMSTLDHRLRIRVMANLRKAITLSKDSMSIVTVVINSKDTCLLLQDQKWTIANTSNETRDELSGFKLVNELQLADFYMFDFKA